MRRRASAPCSSVRRAPTTGRSTPASIGHCVGAPAGAHHLVVARQQPVDAHLGDRATGDPHDHQPTVLARERRESRKLVAAHRIQHDVDPAPRELGDLLAPSPVGAHYLVGAGRASDLLLVSGRDGGDGARTEAAGHLQRGGPHPPSGAVDYTCSQDASRPRRRSAK